MSKNYAKQTVRKINNPIYTQHHILNRCRRDLYNCIEDKDNKVRLKDKHHKAWHDMQGNNTPLETLNDLKRLTRVMSPAAKELYDMLRNMSEEEFYNDKFLKNGISYI